MKSLIRNITLLVLISLGFSSCVYDYYPEGEEADGNIDPNTTILFLDVRALNPSTTTTEKIKSVRIIITGKPANNGDTGGTDAESNSTSIVECNRLYEFPIVNASSFSYTLTWASSLGQKSVYVIANEASISGDLTEQLNEYEEMSSAVDLEKWLEGYSFAPQYTATDDTYYLPYSYSKTDFEPLPGKVNPVNCWLSPIATKFVFYFENKRSAAVNVEGISMAYVNTESFMMPHVDKDALYMEYGSESLYWPDWLAIVSKDSWNYPEFGENEGFNQLYGWITDYSVPKPSDSHLHTFIDTNDAFTVAAMTETTTEEGKEEIPGTFTTPIFYLPESINHINPSEATVPESPADGEQYGDQSYYLTIKLKDLGQGKAPEFKNVLIPNLNALFRNTFVVIKMVMGEGEIEIYAEIAPWNVKTANGWVSEGGAPSGNPFSIKKK